ncbi:MAG TPA: EAL domain-containing protein [Frankiaceae bacterium]|nr:EAL domain-containing protein [Frankiaceae bacterium]
MTLGVPAPTTVPRQVRDSDGDAQRARPAASAASAAAAAAAATSVAGVTAAWAAGEVLRDLVHDVVGEHGWLATWVAGPDGLRSVSPSAAGLLGLVEHAPQLLSATAALLAPVLVVPAAGVPWDAYEAETDAAGADGVPRRVRISARNVPNHPGWTAGTLEPADASARAVTDVEDRYHQLLELSPDGLIVHDAGVIVYANPAVIAFARASGLSDLIGKPILSFVAPESQPELLRRLAGLTGPGSVSAPSEAILLRMDGTTMVMEATSVRTAWNGKPAFQVIMRDLTERRAAEAATRAKASLIEQVSDAIVAVDDAGIITTWNPAASRTFGWTAEEAVGHPIASVVGAECAGALGAAAGGARLETRFARSTGDEIDVELAVDRLGATDGATAGLVMICSDITERRHQETERKVAQARLLHQSRHDVLTGLANRAMVIEHLDALLARVAEGALGAGQVAVLFLDLDRFKLVNDSLGHAGGDEVLRIVGRRLASAVRGSDLVGRLAGDEFVVLVADLPGSSDRLSGTDTSRDLDQLVNRLFGTLAEPLSVNGRRLTVTASIGIAVLDPNEVAGAEDLLRDADVAMYTAKQSGRSRAVTFNAQLRSQTLYSLELEEDLRRAVQNHDISVAYQPLVDLASGAVTSTEALARWQHPTRGSMSPALFIPVAEEAGMIGHLGTAVLRDACASTARWRGAGFPRLRVAVNLSGRQLADANLVPDVVATLAQVGLPASALSLEITESVLMTDPEAAARTLKALAEVGVGLSVDDFGTGYSSLSYLRQFPVDTIKIDRSFVTDITHDLADLAIVDSVIGLAHRLNLRTVAEGAETKEQVDVLQELGCHQIQGYYFSRPLPPEGVPGFIRSR